MLILNRRAGESIVIDGKIVVTVLQVDGDRIKLGIAAPREVSVLRRELCDEVEAANRLGALPSACAADEVLAVLRQRLPLLRPSSREE